MVSYVYLGKAVIAALILFLLSACGNSNNGLTEEERAEGWELLFDGQSTDQWRGYGIDMMPDQWVIADDSLHIDPDIDGSAGDIISKEQYSDFELVLDWKIEEGSNSGIFYHVVEDAEYSAIFLTGPEMQILDNENHKDADIPTHRAGALCGVMPALLDASKPAGEWNEVRIVVDNGKLEHWLNGQKVIDTSLWDDKWLDMVANSEYADWPGYAKSKIGHIALQNNSGHTWFRNIKIRRLN